MNTSTSEKQTKRLKSKKPVPGKAKTGKETADKGLPLNDAKFRGDGLKFKCKLVGSADVDGPRGDRMCVDAIKKIKLQALKLHKESREHKQKITLHVTLKGIKILDEKSQRVEYEHAINTVSYITHDPEDKKIFGYVCSEPSSAGHRLFAIKSEKFIAAVITANLFELFQVVFKLRQEAGLLKKTPNTLQTAAPSNGPDQEPAESLYEELDQDNGTETSSPKDDNEAEYEELGPVISRVGQSNEQISPSPKVPTPDGRDRSGSSVSSTPSNFNSEPFFSPSALDESADYATVASVTILRSGSVSSASSETNSIDHRSLSRNNSQAASLPLASDAMAFTPAFDAGGTTTTKEFQVSFPAPFGVRSESSEQEQTSTQGNLPEQGNLFANFDKQASFSGTEPTYINTIPVDDPFASSGDQTSGMFVSSEGFAADFDTAYFSPDPFDPSISDERNKGITVDAFGKEAIPTDGSRSFDAAFKTTHDPFLAMPSDGSQEEAGDGTPEMEHKPIPQSEQFDVAFSSSFSSDTFASEVAKDKESANSEKRTVEAEIGSGTGVAFETSSFSADPFISSKSKGNEPQTSAQNVKDTKVHSQQEPQGFEVTFDTSPFPGEPFCPVSPKADESQRGANTAEADSFPKSGKFKETFDVTPLSFSPLPSNTDEPKDITSIAEEQSIEFSAKFQTAFDEPSFTVEPCDSNDDKIESPKETEDWTTQGSMKFETAFDTPTFTVDPFGSTSKDDKIQTTEETDDQTTQGSMKFETAFDTPTFTVDPFGSTSKIQTTEETDDQTMQGSTKFETAFDTTTFTVDPFGSTSKDDKIQTTEETDDQTTQGPTEFQMAFDTPTFTADPFSSTASKYDNIESPEEREDRTMQGSSNFQTTFDTPSFTVDPFDSTASKNDKMQSTVKTLEETEDLSAQKSGKFKVAFDTAPFDSFSPNDGVPHVQTEITEETKNHLFEVSFEASQFPDTSVESTVPKRWEQGTIETGSPWGNSFGQEQVQVSSFGNAFTPESDDSASLFSTAVSNTVAVHTPLAQVTTDADDVFSEPQSTLTRTAAALPRNDETETVVTSTDVIPSTDPFESLEVQLPTLFTRPDVTAAMGSREGSDPDTGGELDSTGSVPNLGQDKEANAKQVVASTSESAPYSSNEADDLKRASKLAVAATTEPTQRPVSPSRPPPLPPRVLAAPPVPARPRSTSNFTSFSDVASPGYSGSTPPSLMKSGTPKKIPPALPPRVDLEGKSGLIGNKARAESFGTGAFKAVFNGMDTSTDTHSSSWAVSWPLQTKLSEDGNAEGTGSANKSADPFSDNFFTNFDTPQQNAKTAVFGHDSVDDPFSSNDSSPSTAFGEQDLFASFPPSNEQTSSSGDNVTDHFSSSYSPFTTKDPFDGVCDPFPEKGVLGNDPFDGSPAQNSNHGGAIKLCDKDPFAGNFEDSFA